MSEYESLLIAIAKDGREAPTEGQKMAARSAWLRSADTSWRRVMDAGESKLGIALMDAMRRACFLSANQRSPLEIALVEALDYVIADDLYDKKVNYDKL